MRCSPILLLLLLLLAAFPCAAQVDLLRSGPMVGYTEMREVMLWVQTTRPARVQIIYWDRDSTGHRYATQDVTTTAIDAGVAHLLADSVLPGRRYSYELQINGIAIDQPWPLEFRTPPVWRYVSEPPTFTVALGSCAYINEEGYERPGPLYGGDYQIFTKIAARRPDVMVWLGDFVYLREADWSTRTGIIHRYSYSRALPEMQPLLGATANYAIWDDHDYGWNDGDRGYRNKETSLDIFKLFWCNPTYGTHEMPGVMTSFVWGDAEFFLLDDRYYRSPDDRTTGERTLLGSPQIEWLIDKLVTSSAAFKIVCMGGQVLNPVAKWETYATYPDEQKLLLDRIAQEKIAGLFFVSGDRHHSELTTLPRPGSYPLHDLTVSPLTSKPYLDTTEANTLRIPGTYVGIRNFGLLEFAGPAKKRTMTIRIIDSNGGELWTRTIKAEDLTQ